MWRCKAFLHCNSWQPLSGKQTRTSITLFSSPNVGPYTCLCSAFALTVIPTLFIDIVRQSKAWQPLKHVLLLSCIQSPTVITYCIHPEPAWAYAARVQVCPYGGTQLLLSPSWAVRVGRGVCDWCIFQSGGLFRWVASCTNNDTWWKPLSLSNDRKWRWIVSCMGSDFVEQEEHFCNDNLAQ